MVLDDGASFGRYAVGPVLGRGGMGTVYRAHDPTLDRDVALKVLSPELANEPAFRERFVTESRLAASLDHPNILPIFEAGEVDGRLFIAMRYVAGPDGSTPDLASRLATEGRLSAERASRTIAQIAMALDAAHRAGLVHRDVKPANILIGSESGHGAEHAYLSDFGLTKRRADAGDLTRSGQVFGTVQYMAPEQIEGRAVDGRADIYSLGCVLHELLTGEPPYRRDTEMATLYAHLRAPVPRVDPVRADVPASIGAVVERAMAKDPADRFGSGREMADALAGSASASVIGPPPRSDARRTGLAPLVALGLAGAAIVGLVAVNLGGGTPGSTASPAPSPPSAGGDVSIVELGEPQAEFRPDPVGLDEGRWQFADFLPATTFQVGSGWFAYRDYPDGAGLLHAPDPSNAFDADAWVDFARTQVVYVDGCVDETALLGGDPQSFISWIEEHPYLDAGDPFPTTVGGQPGISISATALEIPEGTCEQSTAPRVVLFPLADDTFFAFPGDVVSFHVVGWDDAPVMIAIDADEDVREAAESIVNSIEFPT